VDGKRGKAAEILLEWSPRRAPVEVAEFNLQTWLEGVNRKLGGRVIPELEAYPRDRGKVIETYHRAMKKLVREEGSDSDLIRRIRRKPGRGFDRLVQRRALEAIKRALAGAEKRGELLASLPAGASRAFRLQQEKSASELELLAKAYDLKVQRHLEFYTAGIGKKADDLARKGFLDASRALKKIIGSVGDDTGIFVEMLFSGTPRASLPWKKDLPPKEDPLRKDAVDREPEGRRRF